LQSPSTKDEAKAAGGYNFSDFFKIYVSHGSVATQLKCGRIFNNYFIASCPQYSVCASKRIVKIG